MVSVDVVGRYPQEEDCTFLKKSKICRICHDNMHNAKIYAKNLKIYLHPHLLKFRPLFISSILPVKSRIEICIFGSYFLLQIQGSGSAKGTKFIYKNMPGVKKWCDTTKGANIAEKKFSKECIHSRRNKARLNTFSDISEQI